MDAMDFGFGEEDDLSSALGTETLAARDIIPEGFDNTPRARGVLELTQLGRCHTTRPYTGRPACWDHCLKCRQTQIGVPISAHVRNPDV
jgi:hypothetical protein